MNGVHKEQRVSKATFTMGAWMLCVIIPAIGYVRYEQVQNVQMLEQQTLKVSESTRYRTCVENRRLDYIQTQIDLAMKYANDSAVQRRDRLVKNLETFEKIKC